MDDVSLQVRRKSIILNEADAILASTASGEMTLEKQTTLINREMKDVLHAPFDSIEGALWDAEPSAPMIKAAEKYVMDLTRREATNFYHSIRFLPLQKRKGIAAIYGFCRRADDIADGDHIETLDHVGEDELNGVEAYQKDLESHPNYPELLDQDEGKKRLKMLYLLRLKLSTCFGDKWSTDPVFVALRATVERFKISRTYFDEVIDGMEDDLYCSTYPDLERLRIYCHRVASATGILCIDVYGTNNVEMARLHGEALGQFMQMVNILRDVSEDAARSRTYLPVDLLKRHGVNKKDLNGGASGSNAWRSVVSEWGELCEEQLQIARPLLRYLPADTQYSPAVMIALYRGILRRIQIQPDLVFKGRVRLSKTKKLWISISTLMRTRLFPAKIKKQHKG